MSQNDDDRPHIKALQDGDEEHLVVESQTADHRHDDDRPHIKAELIVGIFAILIALISCVVSFLGTAFSRIVFISTPIVSIVTPTEYPPATLSSTSFPTYTPYPTYTPASSVEIAVLNISSEAQADGTVKNTADLSIAPLGLGSLQLTSPATIKLGESSVIRLTITPDSVLADLPRVTVPTVSANDPGYVLEFSDRLQIYPIMTAELKGVNFEIASDSNPEKPVTSSLPVEWIWNVTPKSGGKQTLILVISIPVIIDQARDIVSAETLKNIPIEIQVEVTATPIPSQTPQPTQTPIPTLTPTPLPAITRIGEQLIENASAIIIAVIGLIGVLAGVYIAYLNIKKPKATASTAKGKSKKK